MNNEHRTWTGFVLPLLLISAAVLALPGYVALTKRASSVMGLDYDERRSYLQGEFYQSLSSLRTALQPDEDIALVMRRLRDVDQGVFVNYYLYPRRVRFYYDLDVYRNDASPGRPETLWYIDLDRSTRVREMTYDEIRVEQSLDEPAISPMIPFQTMKAGRWTIPLIASVDGAASDRYATEAVFLSEAATKMTMVLQPSGKPCVLELQARIPMRVTNLMTHCLRTMGAGWADVETETDVSAGVWLANRGRDVFSEVRMYEAPLDVPVRLFGGERVWLLNPGDAPLATSVDEELLELPPRSLVSRSGWEGETLRVEASGPFIVFASTKLEDGNTSFSWPEPVQ